MTITKRMPYQISRAPGIIRFLGNIWYQGQDAIFGAVYAHKGRHVGVL